MTSILLTVLGTVVIAMLARGLASLDGADWGAVVLVAAIGLVAVLVGMAWLDNNVDGLRAAGDQGGVDSRSAYIHDSR